MVQVLTSDVAVDVAILADGFALCSHERTVSRLHCSVCGVTADVDGIVDHLVFEHDHRHGG